LAAGQHGRDPRRDNALTVYRVIFALELTHDVNMLLPLLLAVTVAPVDSDREGEPPRIPLEP
jgi:hypothetical protein